MLWTKPRNCLKNEEDQVLSQICPKGEISWKSRQFWTETQHQGCDKINKGDKK